MDMCFAGFFSFSGCRSMHMPPSGTNGQLVVVQLLHSRGLKT